MNKGELIGDFDYNIIQALPYFLVLIMSVIGINVFIVLTIGIITFILVGIVTGSLVYATALSSIGTGISGMFETMIVTILVASVTALIKNNGGFEAILQLIRKKAKKRKGAMFGITVLTAFMDLATANNTVAIVVAAPIAKEIGDEYKIEARKVASLLDVSSCIMHGIIPYGAQLLVASSIAGIPSFNFIPYLIYPFVLCLFVIISIVFDRKKN
jgi:Na+/H+ antiporter NhaC